RRPQCSTPFPSTTLFRSDAVAAAQAEQRVEVVAAEEGVELGRARVVVAREVADRLGAHRPVELDAEAARAEGGQARLGVLLGPRSEEHTSELQSRENLVC